MLNMTKLASISTVIGLGLVAMGAFASESLAANSSWAVVSFNQNQSGVREGTTPYSATQNASVSTQTKYGSNALAQSSGGGSETMVVRNSPFVQTQGGNFGSTLSWASVSGCGNPTPCSGSGTGLSNMNADTTGSMTQAQQSNDSTSTGNQTATISQTSGVGSNQSALSGTISQNTAAVPPPVVRRIDPQQNQTIMGQTHSQGVVFIPVTSIFTDISHFIQTITVTAQNILSF